jgi:hypothetical protein
MLFEEFSACSYGIRICGEGIGPVPGFLRSFRQLGIVMLLEVDGLGHVLACLLWDLLGDAECENRKCKPY